MKLKRRHIDVVLITCGIIFSIFAISCAPCVSTGNSGCRTDASCCDYPDVNCNSGICESCSAIGTDCEWDMDCCDYPDTYCDFTDEVCKTI